jgi:hypothetical protein
MCGGSTDRRSNADACSSAGCAVDLETAAEMAQALVETGKPQSRLFLDGRRARERRETNAVIHYFHDQYGIFMFQADGGAGRVGVPDDIVDQFPRRLKKDNFDVPSEALPGQLVFECEVHAAA